LRSRARGQNTPLISLKKKKKLRWGWHKCAKIREAGGGGLPGPHRSKKVKRGLSPVLGWRSSSRLPHPPPGRKETYGFKEKEGSRRGLTVIVQIQMVKRKFGGVSESPGGAGIILNFLKIRKKKRHQHAKWNGRSG